MQGYANKAYVNSVLNSLFLSLSLCLRLSLCLSVCLSVSLSLSVSPCNCFSLSVFFSLTFLSALLSMSLFVDF